MYGLETEYSLQHSPIENTVSVERNGVTSNTEEEVTDTAFSDASCKVVWPSGNREILMEKTERNELIKPIKIACQEGSLSGLRTTKYAVI